jgi:hypothetical protein
MIRCQNLRRRCNRFGVKEKGLRFGGIAGYWATIEAQAFAYLAVRTLQGLPITFPQTTGVAAPMPGGVVAQPN